MTSAATKNIADVLTLVLTVGRGQSLETPRLAVLVGVFYGAAVQPAPGATLEAEFED
jgi:hypothetical protein